MSEINNNNFGKYNIPKQIDLKQMRENQPKGVQAGSSAEEPVLVPDTGVLGRSLVKPSNGANISKTVDETVALMQQNPDILGCSEGVFDFIYNDLIAQGKNPDDAFFSALMAEEEFLKLKPHN